MSMNIIFPLVVGAVCVVVAVFKGLLGMISAATKEKKCTEKVQASIAALEQKMIRKKQYFVPVYKYEVKGKTYQTKTTAEPKGEHKIGEKEHILVDPDKPERIIPGKTRSLGTSPAAMFYIFGIAGVGLLVYAVTQMFAA